MFKIRRLVITVLVATILSNYLLTAHSIRGKMEEDNEEEGSGDDIMNSYESIEFKNGVDRIPEFRKRFGDEYFMDDESAENYLNSI